MRTGFVIEAHVVVYCDSCGDTYTEFRYDSLCFASIAQAISYIAARGAGIGWVYDGDRVLCDGCIATARCAQQGHLFPEPRRWPLGEKNRPRTCTRCGISDTEIEE
ncbi:hypothetical protein [Nocardia sp. NPDC051570]|uniref:hypothetical protein n=1 Tax=Nocardia sp. NPDC051570 TaxID=3364324 RepID=UPI0037B7AA0D